MFKCKSQGHNKNVHTTVTVAFFQFLSFEERLILVSVCCRDYTVFTKNVTCTGVSTVAHATDCPAL